MQSPQKKLPEWVSPVSNQRLQKASLVEPQFSEDRLSGATTESSEGKLSGATEEQLSVTGLINAFHSMGTNITCRLIDRYFVFNEEANRKKTDLDIGNVFVYPMVDESSRNVQRYTILNRYSTNK